MTVTGDNVTDISETTSHRPFVITSQPPSSESTSSQSDRTRRLSVHQDVTTASVLMRQSTVVSQTSTIVSDLNTNYSTSALLLNETVTVTSPLTTMTTAADTTTGL